MWAGGNFKCLMSRCYGILISFRVFINLTTHDIGPESSTHGKCITGYHVCHLVQDIVFIFLENFSV